MITKRLLAASAAWGLAPALAAAGGYVVPIIDSVPQVVASGAGGSNTGLWVMGGAVVLCAIFCGRGGDNPGANPPGDHGGPCFREGTLIRTPDGWTKVEELEVGMYVHTSEGDQPILSVEGWTPTEFKDRPAIFLGVRMSPNHAINVLGARIPALSIATGRGIIDGARYIHVLVERHAWLMVRADLSTKSFAAESLLLTPDMPALSERFPEAAASHAQRQCAPEGSL